MIRVWRCDDELKFGRLEANVNTPGQIGLDWWGEVQQSLHMKCPRPMYLWWGTTLAGKLGNVPCRVFWLVNAKCKDKTVG